MPNPIDRLAEDLIAVKRAAPDATPGVAYGLAQTDDPVTSALATQGFAEANFFKAALERMEAKDQLASYGSLSPERQRMLSQVGYLPPHQQEGNRSWWDHIKGAADAVGSVVAGATTGVAAGASLGAWGGIWGAVAGGVVGGVVGGVRGGQLADDNFFKALSWAPDDALHAYRALTLVGEEQEQRGNSRWMPWTWTDTEWARAWEETGDDLKDFSVDPEEALSQFDVKVSPASIPIVADIVRGLNEVDLVAKYGLDAVENAQAEPSFAQAVATIDSFSISPGRRLAHSLGISKLAKPGTSVKVLGVEVSAFDLYSGTADGLVRWFGDPLNVGFGGAKIGRKAAERLAVAKGIDTTTDEGRQVVDALSRHKAGVGSFFREKAIAKYGIQSAEDVRRVSAHPETQRAYQRIANHFSEGGQGVSGVLREFKDLSPMAEDLARAAPSSVDDVQLFMEGKAALVATLGGRAAGFASLEPVAPHLGKLGAAFKNIGEPTLRAIEQLENVPVLRKGAIGFRRFTNLVPRKGVIDANNPTEAAEFFRQAALYALPRSEVDNLVNAFLASDVAGKRTIYTGMLRTLAQKLGADEVPELRQAFDRIIGSVDGSLNRPYGLGVDGADVSKVAREGTRPANYGVAEHQLTEVWALPDFREIVRARRAATIWRNMPGVRSIPDGAIDAVMDRVWKPLVLLRLGFPIRAGGEEVARKMLADGFLPTVRARLAGSAVKSWEKQRTAQYARALDFDKMGPSWKLIRDNMVEQTLFSLSKVKSATFAQLAGEKYLRAAELLLLRYGPSMLPANISAMRDVGGALNRPEQIVKRLKDSAGRERVVRFREGRDWRGYQQVDEFQAQAWQAELRRHGGDRSFQIYLDNIDDPEDALVAYLSSDEAAGIRKTSPRADHEAMGLASREEALREWARTMKRSYDGLLHGPGGQRVDDVVNLLREGKAITIDDLHAVPASNRPLSVAGREMLPVFGSWWEGVVEAGFKPIGKMINWISRQPIFIHEFARALDEVAPIVAKMRQAGVDRVKVPAKRGGRYEEAIEKVSEEWAYNLAVERTYLNVDNSELRSQFSVMHRNLFPFWHAQEQFVKRWARTILKDPGVVSRAQLTMSGLRHAGGVHTDEDGNDFFFYPGVGFAFGALAKGSNLIFGTNIEAGIPVGLTGKVKFIAPGIESPRAALAPSPSPLLSVPLALARERFPTLAAVIGDVEEKALGSELAQGRPVWEQLVPTTVARLYRTFMADEKDDSQVASAMMTAMQHLEANGQGLPEDPSPEEQEAFQDRVEQTGRAILGLRALFGFAVPATPQVEFLSSLSDEFNDLISKTGDIEEATNRFLARNPGATAWTVFKTKPTAKGLRLDPNAATADFIEEHGEFIRKYGGVAGHFIPPAPGNFDFRAWRNQFAYGLRERKTTEELWKDIKIADAADTYYTSKDRYIAASAGLQGDEADALDASWREWQDSYFRMHPLFFREHIALAAQRDADRQSQLATLEAALNDPAAPDTGAGLRDVVTSWRRYNEAMAPLRNDQSSVARSRRAALTAGLNAWGQSLADQRARAVFMSLVRPLLSI